MTLAACAGAPGPGSTASPAQASLAPSAAPTTPAPTAPASASATATSPTETPSAATSASPSAAASVGPSSAASVSPSSIASPTADLAWVERSDIAGATSARTDHTWTVDESGSVAYLFGGRVRGGASAELWRFDLATDEWAIVEPEGSAPPPRWGHTATWVPGVGLVVWSGQAETGFFADIWAYDAATNAWRELPTSGAVPEARYGSCAALGPDGRLWISHGFTQDDGRFADTRAYDFATGEWIDETPAGRVPVERCLHDCWWSADGSQLIMYGGQTTDVPALGDAWAYDVGTGDWTASADGAAAARNLYGLVALENGAVVFGGGSLDRDYLDDTWLLDEQTLALTQLDIERGPAARAGSTLIDDPARGRLLLFGGDNTDGLLGDIWEIGRP